MWIPIDEPDVGLPLKNFFTLNGPFPSSQLILVSPVASLRP